MSPQRRIGGGCSAGSAFGPSRLSRFAASSAERPESRTTPSLSATAQTPTPTGGTEIGGRRSSAGIRAAILTSMNSRGAENCARPARLWGRRTCHGQVFRQSRILPGFTAERATAGPAGYTTSPSPLLTGVITPDGVSYTRVTPDLSCAARGRLRGDRSSAHHADYEKPLRTAERTHLPASCQALTRRNDHWPLATGLAGACGESLTPWQARPGVILLTRAWVMPVIGSEVDAEPTGCRTG
jgi:hypothetical protein